MNTKMIVTDLDRTLLKNDKTISAYTIEVLNQCHKQNIKVVFATARPKRAVKTYLEQLDIDAVIVHNGSVVYIEDKLYKHDGIESTIAKKILLAIISKYPEINLSVEINDQLYANYDVSNTWVGLKAIFTNFTDLIDLPAEKIIIDFKSQREFTMINQLLHENPIFSSNVYLELSEGKLGLIMAKGATKFNAVKTLADYYRISTQEIMAFGDDKKHRRCFSRITCVQVI